MSDLLTLATRSRIEGVRQPADLLRSRSYDKLEGPVGDAAQAAVESNKAPPSQRRKVSFDTGAQQSTTSAYDGNVQSQEPYFSTGTLERVEASSSIAQTRIKKGFIQYSWDDGDQNRKVPYFYVPDGIMSDPNVLDLVLRRMRLPHPNLLLHFSALRLPVEEWNRGWNYDFGGDGEVDEEELPFPVPPGTSRTTESISKYMAQVVRHRVLSIIGGVSQACVQAGAFLMVSEHERGDMVSGMYDYVVPYVTEASVVNSVVMSTYCIEEARNFEGSENYLRALVENAVDEVANPDQQPKPFKVDITLDMEIMGLSMKKKEDEGEGKKKKEGKGAKGGKNLKRTSQRELYKHFQKRRYLPAKDVTHMLVFESKDSEEKFKSILKARTPECNFVMNGGLSAMRFFEDSALKRGTPFFVLQGTGGAADQCALVLQHMQMRKMLDESAQADKDISHQAQMRDNAAKVGGVWTKLKGIKPKTSRVADEKAGDDKKGDATNLESLIDMKKQVEDELKKSQDNRNYLRAMAMQKTVQELVPLIEQGEKINDAIKEAIEKNDVTDDNMQKARDDQKDFDLKATMILGKRHNLDLLEADPNVGNLDKLGQEVDDDDGTSAEGGGSKKEKAKARKAVLAPPKMYQESIDLGKKGLAWEKAIGMPYERWYKEGQPNLGHECPEEWDIPWGGDNECEKGRHPITEERVMCKLETCAMCMLKKVAERAENRKLAKEDKPWSQALPAMKHKFTQYWIEDNPIVDDPVLLNLFGEDQVADMARVILSNVWEAPEEDAMVTIDVLDKEMNIEEIMDRVTGAMSAGVTDSGEVGEKTAMRRRLLEAWKLVRILEYNAGRLYRLNHVLQFLVITFTLLSTVVGVMTVQVENARQLVGEGRYADWIERLTPSDFGLIEEILRPVNIVLPLLASFFLALISKVSPQSKAHLLDAARVHVTSEIFKCRTRTGEYSPLMAGNIAPTSSQEDQGGRAAQGGGADQAAAGKANVSHGPRSVLANKIEMVWSDLGSSEIRQAALVKPKGLDMLNVNVEVKVDQHPALFEEGQVFHVTSSKKKHQEVIDQFHYDFVDDGLKPIGANDYIDIRVSPYLRLYEGRAPSLSWRLSVMQFFIFAASTTSTALGAFDMPAYIPVALGVGGAFGGIIAYQNLETRLARVNSALVSLSRLMVWWHGLSVIEKRIPGNKTFLVDTMEGIIQLESGNMVLNARKATSGGQGGGQQGGEGEKKKGDA